MTPAELKAVANDANASKAAAKIRVIDNWIERNAKAGLYHCNVTLPLGVDKLVRQHYVRLGFRVSTGYEGQTVIEWADA